MKKEFKYILQFRSTISLTRTKEDGQGRGESKASLTMTEVDECAVVGVGQTKRDHDVNQSVDCAVMIKESPKGEGKDTAAEVAAFASSSSSDREGEVAGERRQGRQTNRLNTRRVAMNNMLFSQLASCITENQSTSMCLLSRSEMCRLLERQEQNERIAIFLNFFCLFHF